MYIGTSTLDANVKPGLHEELQHGIMFPNGSITWGGTGKAESIRTPYGDTFFEEHSPGFFERHPSATLDGATRLYRDSLAKKNIPLTDDMVLRHVQRKITIIVGETEVVS